MKTSELTEDQKAVIAACNASLKAAGLKTLTELEDAMGMMGVAALESVRTGQDILKRLNQAHEKLAKLNKPEARRPK